MYRYRRHYGYRYRRYRRYRSRNNYDDSLLGEFLIAFATILGWALYHTIRGIASLISLAWKAIANKRKMSSEYSATYTTQPVEARIEDKSTSIPIVRDKQTAQGPALEKSRYFRKHSLLTEAEDNFYQVLDKIAKENNYIIQTKVRLEGLVGVRFYEENWWGLRNRIKSREMDFVLCEKQDSSLDPILVIELDDSSHLREDRIERDQNLNQILHEAGLPILHVPAAYSYNPTLLLREIKDKMEDQK